MANVGGWRKNYLLKKASVENKKGKIDEKKAQCHRAKRSGSRFFLGKRNREKSYAKKKRPEFAGRFFFVAQWN